MIVYTKIYTQSDGYNRGIEEEYQKVKTKCCWLCIIDNIMYACCINRSLSTFWKTHEALLSFNLVIMPMRRELEF